MQFRKQISPASCARVAVGNHGYRLRPRDREIWIARGHPDVLRRIMRTVDAVADICNGGERLKTMQETRRDVEMSKVIVVQQECLLLTKSGRICADVDDHVINGAMGAADEFGLATARTAVHAPHHALHGPRLRILHEFCRSAWRTDVIVEDFYVERSGEQSPFIAKGLRHQNHHAGKLSLLDSHGSIFP